MGAEFVIYLGDWNVIINPEIDNINYLHVNNHKAREVIKNRMVSDGLVDIWRLNDPLKKDFFVTPKFFLQGTKKWLSASSTNLHQFFLTSEGVI